MRHERIVGLHEENAAAWDELRGQELNEREWITRRERLRSLEFPVREPIAEGPSVWIARQMSPARGLDGSA